VCLAGPGRLRLLEKLLPFAKTYFNNGTGPDALPSPLGTFPFSAADVAPVTFGAPGVYAVKVVVRDDDKGTDFISLPKLVTDNFECTRNHGFWKQQFKASVSGKGRQHINDAALLAYLDIINFASSVFSENTPASTVEQAWAVLWPNKDLDDDDGDPSDKLQKALREALATWLNFARGMVLWDELITVRFGDHDDEPGVTKMFYQWMAEVEGVLLNPTSTHEDYVRAKDIAEDINDSDEDNPACDEDDDDEEGEDKEADKIEDTGKDAEKGEADSGSGDTGKSKKGK